METNLLLENAVSRSLGGEESLDNIFRRSNDAHHSQRREAAANGTQYLNIQPSITACQCDGLACQTQEKHVGESISICLWSNFLDIASVSNMTLHVGDFTYKPVVNGTVNDLTELSLHGRLAVVTTMTISAFFNHSNPYDLVVDATVSFAPNGRRDLIAVDVGNATLDSSRLLRVTRVNKVRFCLYIFIFVAFVLWVLEKSVRCLKHCRHQEQVHDEDGGDSLVV